MIPPQHCPTGEAFLQFPLRLHGLLHSAAGWPAPKEKDIGHFSGGILYTTVRQGRLAMEDEQPQLDQYLKPVADFPIPTKAS